MTKDLNKNISSIQYNLLNLPTNISYSSGKSAAYIYDATGRKLRTSYKASASATPVPTDYCGNMIYENGVLKQILVDGGYMTVTGTPFYYYYLQDHLGSNRVVVNTGGTATQINHFCSQSVRHFVSITVKASQGVTITKDFEVKSGAEFNITIE